MNKLGNYKVPVYKIAYLRPTDNIIYSLLKTLGWVVDWKVFSQYSEVLGKIPFSHKLTTLFLNFFWGGGDGGMLEGSHISSPWGGVLEGS